MFVEQAIEIAARCWCDDRTKTKVMDSDLATVFAETLVEKIDDAKFEILDELFIDSEYNQACSIADAKDNVKHFLNNLLLLCDQDHYKLFKPLVEDFINACLKP